MKFTCAFVAFVATVAVANPVGLHPRVDGPLGQLACKPACDLTCDRLPSWIRGICKSGCKAVCEAAAEDGEEFHPESDLITDEPESDGDDEEVGLATRGVDAISAGTCGNGCDKVCKKVPKFLRGHCRKACKAGCKAAAEEGEEFDPASELAAAEPVSEEDELDARGLEIIPGTCKTACDSTCKHVPKFIRGACKKACKAGCKAAAEAGEEFDPESEQAADELEVRGLEIIPGTCKTICDNTCGHVPSFLRSTCKKVCRGACGAAAEAGEAFDPENDS